MQKFYKNLSIWLIIALAAVFLLHYFKTSPDRYHTVAYTDFLQKVDSGFLSKVRTVERTIYWETSNGEIYKTVVPQSNQALEHLLKKNITVFAEETAKTPWFMQTLLMWLPILLFAFLWFFYFQKSGGQGGGGGGACHGLWQKPSAADQS